MKVEWFTLFVNQTKSNNLQVSAWKKGTTQVKTVDVRSLKGNKRGKLARVTRSQIEADQWRWPDGSPVNTEHMLLSLLMPTNVKEFYRRLEAELDVLCGPRGAHSEHTFSRYGAQGGSIFLGGQRVAIQKPRVRGPGGEALLQTYARFQDPTLFERAVLGEGLRKVSRRDYKAGLPLIAGSFGFSPASVSRSWTKASQKKFDELMNRDLSGLDIIAIFIDGKRFKKYGVVVALGVSTSGKKFVLGIYQADTESGAACLGLLDDLERRGLPKSGLLFVVDGGSGLNSALEQKYSISDVAKRTAVRARCHFHKWNNLDEILGKKNERVLIEAKSLFWAMREAKDAVEARAHATSLETLLKRSNLSALKSFQEAKADLLVIHALGLSAQLRSFFSTTNAIESVNSLTEEDLRRVKRWQNSAHFQRWYATSALNSEKRMRRVKGHSGLPALKTKLRELCAGVAIDNKRAAA